MRIDEIKASLTDNDLDPLQAWLEARTQAVADAAYEREMANPIGRYSTTARSLDEPRAHAHRESLTDLRQAYAEETGVEMDAGHFQVACSLICARRTGWQWAVRTVKGTGMVVLSFPGEIAHPPEVVAAREEHATQVAGMLHRLNQALAALTPQDTPSYARLLLNRGPGDSFLHIRGIQAPGLITKALTEKQQNSS
jgi:hypothetical protein